MTRRGAISLGRSPNVHLGNRSTLITSLHVSQYVYNNHLYFQPVAYKIRVRQYFKNLHWPHDTLYSKQKVDKGWTIQSQLSLCTSWADFKHVISYITWFNGNNLNVGFLMLVFLYVSFYFRSHFFFLLFSPDNKNLKRNKSRCASFVSIKQLLNQFLSFFFSYQSK